MEVNDGKETKPPHSRHPLSEVVFSEVRCSRELVPQITTIFLRTLGHYVGRYPWWFIAVTTLLTIAFGSSIFFVLDYRTSIEELYIPLDAESWHDRDVAEHFFPVNFSGKFQPDRYVIDLR
jgi:hypothetical protein